MANPEHVKVVKQGAEAIRKWQEANPGVGFDLRGADLNGLDLQEVDLWGSWLDGAWLDRANFTAVDLSAALLKKACLDNANLTWVNLSASELQGARLDGANLQHCNLDGATLKETSFKQAVVGLTLFTDLDLSTAVALETVVHKAPSTIGVDTLYKSKGKIPETFLRGCGVPDALIACLPSLLGAIEAIQFYSCFISYSHTDEEFAKRLHSRMRDEHLRVWYAPEDIKGGHKLHEQIEQAIRVHDKLLLVLSETSMKSEWVATEIYQARQREVKEKRQVLFPIRLVPFEAVKAWECFDADTGKDMAREIREYYIPDFSDWKDHDSFEAGFKRLLADLKAENHK